MNKYLARLNAIIQEKPLPHELTKLPKAPSVSCVSDQGSRVSGIEGPPAKVLQNEIIQQNLLPHEPSKPSKGTPDPVEMPEAAAEMERETYRRLPEQVAARGDPPAPSSVPPLKEQGDYCATRGMDYLAAFWKELTPAEKRRVGGKPALDAWKRVAREADAGRKTPRPAAMPASAKAPASVERGMAMDSVPEPYLDAWARLQARKPGEVTDTQWRQAIEDARRFLGGELASIAADYGWTARDLFDPMIKGVPPGLIWFLCGRPVASIGPRLASVGEGYAVFDKTTRQTRQNAHITNCGRMR